GEIRNEARRKLGCLNARGRGELFSLAVTDKVIAPGDDFARPIYRALQKMEAAGTIVVVRHIVFARPQQLDRNTGRFGDVRRFHHVVVIEPTTERAAGAERVNRDVVLGYAERL